MKNERSKNMKKARKTIKEGSKEGNAQIQVNKQVRK